MSKQQQNCQGLKVPKGGRTRIRTLSAALADYTPRGRLITQSACLINLRIKTWASIFVLSRGKHKKRKSNRRQFLPLLLFHFPPHFHKNFWQRQKTAASAAAAARTVRSWHFFTEKKANAEIGALPRSGVNYLTHLRQTAEGVSHFFSPHFPR